MEQKNHKKIENDDVKKLKQFELDDNSEDDEHIVEIDQEKQERSTDRINLYTNTLKELLNNL